VAKILKAATKFRSVMFLYFFPKIIFVSVSILFAGNDCCSYYRSRSQMRHRFCSFAVHSPLYEVTNRPIRFGELKTMNKESAKGAGIKAHCGILTS